MATLINLSEIDIFDVNNWVNVPDWMAANYALVFGICAVYLFVIFTIQYAMSDPATKGFELKFPLIAWNAFLAVFSILGCINVFPAIYHVVSTKGVTYDLCTLDSESSTVWCMLFCVSKVPELADTLFIVLRKRPLRFLHYYHHVVTLLYCWDGWAVRVENGSWFAAMNLFVHSIMYSYYALSACGLRISDAVRQTITSLQILQMFGGIAVMLHNWQVCNYHPANTMFGMAMYVSYMVLFCKLFYDSYVSPRSGASKKGKAHRE